MHKRFLHTMVLRFGRCQACPVVTVIGILASKAMSLVIKLLIHLSSHELWVSLLQDAERSRRGRMAVGHRPLTGAFNRRGRRHQRSPSRLPWPETRTWHTSCTQ